MNELSVSHEDDSIAHDVLSSTWKRSPTSIPVLPSCHCRRLGSGVQHFRWAKVLANREAVPRHWKWRRWRLYSSIERLVIVWPCLESVYHTSACWKSLFRPEMAFGWTRGGVGDRPACLLMMIQLYDDADGGDIWARIQPHDLSPDPWSVRRRCTTTPTRASASRSLICCEWPLSWQGCLDWSVSERNIGQAV